MQEQDLQQIKKIFDESLDEKLESKFEEKFEENNKKIFKKIFKRMDEMQDAIVTTTKQQFDAHTEQLSNIRDELNKKANESTVMNWGDKQVIPLKSDVDKLKYLHKDEWKRLPDSGTISRALAEEGLKS